MSRTRDFKCTVTFTTSLWDRLQAEAAARDMSPERLVVELVEVQLAESRRRLAERPSSTLRSSSPAAAMTGE